MADNQPHVEKSATSARAGQWGRPVLILLLISCALAVAALGFVYFDFFGPILAQR